MSVVGIPNDKINSAARDALVAFLVPRDNGGGQVAFWGDTPDLCVAAVLAAAVPYIEAGLREQIAAEIEAAGSAQLVAGSSYRCAVFDGHHLAARVARGTQETPND